MIRGYRSLRSLNPRLISATPCGVENHVRWIRMIAAIVVAMTLVWNASAADTAAVAKAKEAADAAIKTAGLKGIESHDTPHLRIVAALPAAKLKPIGDLAEKSFAVAAKALKVEKPDELIPAKLTILLIPDRRSYANILLAITGKRPDATDLADCRTRGDLPFAAVGMPLGEKYTDADWQQLAAAGAAVGVLNKKLGTDPGVFEIPEWAALGFGKLCAVKGEANGTKLAAYRTKVKSLLAGKLRGPVKISDAWGGAKGKEFDALAMSVVEYLAFGSDPEQFTKLLNGFKPSDTNPAPTIQSVLAALEWKWDDLDGQWKQFALKAK